MTSPATPRPVLLLLEDEAELVTVLCLNLQEEFEIETATNSKEARLLLSKRKFDVILSDLMLPGKEQGLDFLQFAMVQQPEAQRILMSGYLNPELLARSVSLAGLSACLMKPVELDVLRAALRAKRKP